MVELSVLHGLRDKGKELLKVEPAIFFIGKNESGDESCSCFFQAAVLKSSLYDRWAKLKSGLTEIIYQRPSIFDLLYWSSVKVLSLMFLEQKNFLLRAFTWNRNLIKLSCTSRTHQEHLNGFRRQKKLVLNFIITEIADKFSLKLPRCIANVERFILYRLVCCFFWSVSECPVPLFKKLIQLPLT